MSLKLICMFFSHSTSLNAWLHPPSSSPTLSCLSVIIPQSKKKINFINRQGLCLFPAESLLSNLWKQSQITSNCYQSFMVFDFLKLRINLIDYFHFDFYSYSISDIVHLSLSPVSLIFSNFFLRTSNWTLIDYSHSAIHARGYLISVIILLSDATFLFCTEPRKI